MSTHPEYDADSMLLTLEILDTNTLPTDDDGKGSLNADYGQRTKKFLETYSGTVDKSKGYSKFDLERDAKSSIQTSCIIHNPPVSGLILALLKSNVLFCIIWAQDK